MLQRTWLLQRWQRPLSWWSGSAPWPNLTRTGWSTSQLTDTGLRKWSQAARSLSAWGALHLACCTLSASQLREAAGAARRQPSQHPQVSTSIFKYSISNSMGPCLTLQTKQWDSWQYWHYITLLCIFTHVTSVRGFLVYLIHSNYKKNASRIHGDRLSSPETPSWIF